MRYIESPSQDAYFNMALEEYVFEHLPTDQEYFMLWQNHNAVVVGKYQNTIQEINPEYIREQHVAVVRRLSGGGAMYQDLGNLNFTFIVDQNASKSLDFKLFIQPVIGALAQMGVTAELNSRNDIVIQGQKFSGNSQYNKKGRTMHHGTLLYDSDLSIVEKALQVSPDKIQSKGIQSIRSRVTNISEHMPQKKPLAEFKQALLRHMFDHQSPLVPYQLTQQDLGTIRQLQQKYASWEWNYGKSPAYNQTKRRRFGFGGIQADLQVQDGLIQAIRFTGDFFGNGEITELEQQLLQVPLKPEAIQKVLESIDTNRYISGLDPQTLATLLLY